MQISFGRKIPVATCSVINKVNKAPQKAIIFEHDCCDKKDYEYFINLPNRWEYKEEVAAQALRKHNYPLSNLGTKIYSIETATGRAIGIMETYQNGKMCDVQHLESKLKGLYGYTGSTLLSFLAQEKLNQNISSIFVSNPAKSARKFYTEHCFFKDCPPLALKLDKTNMERLIKKTQKKTKDKILNLER